MAARTVCAAAATACLMLAAATAHAAPVGTFMHADRGAVAFWAPPGGDVFTEVIVGGFTDLAGSPGSDDVFLGVFQGWCDDARDDLVTRAFVSTEDAGGSFSMGVAFDTANAAGDLTLSGYELRLPSCDDPDFDGASETELGSFPVSVSAEWTGYGPPADHSGIGFFGPLACGSLFAEVGFGRDATAIAVIEGALPLEGGIALTELGPDAFAALGSDAGLEAFTELNCRD